MIVYVYLLTSAGEISCCLEYNKSASVLSPRAISHGLLHTTNHNVMYRYFAFHMMTIRVKEVNVQSIEKKLFGSCDVISTH